MSQCPYGVDVMNKVKGALDLLGPAVKFTFDFIGTTGADGALSSMHGPNEVQGDLAQICAAHMAPGRVVDLVYCQNRSNHDVATNWETCAGEAGIPLEPLRACVEGPEGKSLLSASFARAQARQAMGSPTMFVNGAKYSGKRTSNAFIKAVCDAATVKPAACDTLPKPPTVAVTLLGDKRCEKCNPERLAAMVKSRVENPVVRQLDLSEPAGRALYTSLGGTAKLPLVLFDASLDADKDAQQLFGPRLVPTGSFRSLEVGASWVPACVEPNGCALPQCKDNRACREEVPGKLEVYVMSQCPYAVRALNAMDDVLRTVGGQLDFEVHFIGTADNGALSSMHGAAEVDEDVREICAMKLYPKDRAWMDYFRCRNQNIRSTDWRRCAIGEIDAGAIAACAAAEGPMLLGEDFGRTASLGIAASPSWIVNGRTDFAGIDAPTILRYVCDANRSLSGCEPGAAKASQEHPGPACGK
jgi:hypothetical protein